MIRSFSECLGFVFGAFGFLKDPAYICYNIKPLPKTMQAFKSTHGFYLAWELKAAALF